MAYKAIIKSKWDIACIRKGVEVWSDHRENVVTDQGLNKLLNTMFSSEPKITNWNLLLTGSGSAGTGSSYGTPGYVECTAYDETERPTYTIGVSTDKSLTNSGTARATFTMSTACTINGAALVGGTAGTTKGGTSGTDCVLYSSALFSTPRVVADDEVVNLTCTLTAGE